MSDSSALSDLQHDDVQLESALRSTVQRLLEDDQRDNLTIKRVRTSVEELLGLGEGFFKNDDDWKDRSREVIQEEVNARDSNRSSQCQPPSPNPNAQKPQAPAGQAPKPKSKNREQHPASEESAYASHKKKRKSTSEDELSASDKEQDKRVEKDRVGGVDASNSESELSVLLDEEPRPRKKKRQKSDPQGKGGKQKSVKKKGASNAPVDPDAEEIKRLQGWLIKCGIRKMWHRELAPYESQSSKIKHLKEMLADVGMTGRYSKEKAEQIREERELKADLEAVQEGDKVWGKKEEEEEAAAGEGERPKRRLARGLQDLDFLNDDDGAETD